MGGANEERGVLINEKPNQGARERKMAGSRYCLVTDLK
jgi:hypothetical protein